jgi:hypothetical protein
MVPFHIDLGMTNKPREVRTTGRLLLRHGVGGRTMLDNLNTTAARSR